MIKIIGYFIGFIFLLSGCKTFETKYSCKCNSGNVPKAVLSDGEFKNFNNQEGRLVKIEGFYRFSSEESAIYKDYSSFRKSDQRNAIWLTFNRSCLLDQDSAKMFLIKSPEELLRITGKKVIVWGELDYANTGHLNLYKAAITKICLFKYED